MNLNLFKQDIGIDLGTANTLVYIKGKGIVLEEASVIAYDENIKEVMAVGNEAKAMIGVAPPHINVVRPLKEGVISNFEMTQLMLKSFIHHAIPKIWPFTRVRVVIGVPSGVTEVERRAVEELIQQMGAKEVYVMDEPMAAAIGSGLNVDSPEGCMITDIGGGTSDVAIIALGGIVTSTSLRVAGDKMNDAIINHLRKEFGIIIGEKMAERIKIDIGCASLPESGQDSLLRCNVSGRDIATGLPKMVQITSADLNIALEEPIQLIIDGIKSTLEKAPPELSAEILNSGMVLTGGGALLRGLDQLIAKETGMSISVSESALVAVAMGTGMSLNNMSSIRRHMRIRPGY